MDQSLNRRGNKHPAGPGIFDIDFLAPFEGIRSHGLFPEFVAVFFGLKPVLRTYALRLDRYPLFKKTLGVYGLAAEHSDFRISPKDDTVLVPGGNLVYAYVSRSSSLAARAKRTEAETLWKGKSPYKDLLAFSRLMGYPKCCSDSFLDYQARYPRRPSHLAEYEIYKRTGKPSFYLNNLMRGDHYLISHYPCSYDCGASVKYAKALLGRIRAVRPGLAEEIIALLKHPVLKFRDRGAYVRLLEGKTAEDGDLVYQGSGGDDSLARRFRKGNRLRISKNTMKIFRGSAPAGSYRKKNALDGGAFIFQ